MLRYELAGNRKKTSPERGFNSILILIQFA